MGMKKFLQRRWIKIKTLYRVLATKPFIDQNDFSEYIDKIRKKRPINEKRILEQLSKEFSYRTEDGELPTLAGIIDFKNPSYVEFKNNYSPNIKEKGDISNLDQKSQDFISGELFEQQGKFNPQEHKKNIDNLETYIRETLIVPFADMPSDTLIKKGNIKIKKRKE